MTVTPQAQARPAAPDAVKACLLHVLRAFAAEGWVALAG